MRMDLNGDRAKPWAPGVSGFVRWQQRDTETFCFVVRFSCSKLPCVAVGDSDAIAALEVELRRFMPTQKLE